MGDATFYSRIPALDDFAEMADPAHYVPVPASWVVVITDVRGSTRAIEAGRYKDVNALGVASIVAIRNALADPDVPFVFGGDGATVLCPAGELPRVEVALRGVREIAERAFDLELRCAVVPIEALARAGHPVLVARHRASPHATFALLAGSGVAEAERLAKAEGSPFLVSGTGPSAADLTGFECRWQPLESQLGLVVALLVQVQEGCAADAPAIYRATWREILRIAGEASPAGPANLKLGTGPTDFEVEARLRSGRPTGPGFFGARLRAQATARIGGVLLATGRSAGGFDGARYREEVIQNTDYRKFDETLRAVLDLRPDARDALERHLAAEHASGRIYYGLHAARRALMTCAIRSYDRDHVHFVDGADGGYALAARMLKAQRATGGSPHR